MFKVGTNLSLHYHVFNNTNNLLANTQYNCTAHILNENQEHIFEGSLINNGNNIDKLINIGGNNLSLIGLYTVNLWCNSSTQAGFLSNYFYITQSGIENIDSKFTFVILLGISLLIGFFLFLYVKLDVTHVILKNFVLLVAIYLTLFIPSSMASLINISIGTDLMRYYLLFLKIFSFYLLSYFIWSIADYYGKTDTIKQIIKDNFGRKGGK